MGTKRNSYTKAQREFIMRNYNSYNDNITRQAKVKKTTKAYNACYNEDRTSKAINGLIWRENHPNYTNHSKTYKLVRQVSQLLQEHDRLVKENRELQKENDKLREKDMNLFSNVEEKLGGKYDTKNRN